MSDNKDECLLLLSCLSCNWYSGTNEFVPFLLEFHSLDLYAMKDMNLSDLSKSKILRFRDI